MGLSLRNTPGVGRGAAAVVTHYDLWTCHPAQPLKSLSVSSYGNRRSTPNVADYLRQERLAACVS